MTFLCSKGVCIRKLLMVHVHLLSYAKIWPVQIIDLKVKLIDFHNS